MSHKLTEDQINFLKENHFNLNEHSNVWERFGGSLESVIQVTGMISLRDDRIILTDLITDEKRITKKEVPFVYAYGTSIQLLGISRDADSKNQYVKKVIDMITSLTGEIAGYLYYKGDLFVLDQL